MPGPGLICPFPSFSSDRSRTILGNARTRAEGRAHRASERGLGPSQHRQLLGEGQGGRKMQVVEVTRFIISEKDPR